VAAHGDTPSEAWPCPTTPSLVKVPIVTWAYSPCVGVRSGTMPLTVAVVHLWRICPANTVAVTIDQPCNIVLSLMVGTIFCCHPECLQLSCEFGFRVRLMVSK